MIKPAAVLGFALIVAAIRLSSAVGSTRRALATLRTSDSPRPRLVGPHNFLDEFFLSTYHPRAVPLVIRLRYLFIAFMTSGVAGLLLVFTNSE